MTVSSLSPQLETDASYRLQVSVQPQCEQKDWWFSCSQTSTETLCDPETKAAQTESHFPPPLPHQHSLGRGFILFWQRADCLRTTADLWPLRGGRPICLTPGCQQHTPSVGQTHTYPDWWNTEVGWSHREGRVVERLVYWQTAQTFSPVLYLKWKTTFIRTISTILNRSRMKWVMLGVLILQ